ncbi:MAG: NADH-quinone oxidoreductase subunit A [Acidimicrobiales bacterium]|nr:NADH-quinone oxidoreductase subunit A [Acidimicrobiales bacterium]MCB1259672.1 NADH-quinone oxidoreductase subunit A [Acidimicrobiales bacterium]
MGQYLPIFAMFLLAVIFGVLSLLASKILAPKLAMPAKVAPYECGIVPGRDAPERFPVRFYLVAMIFIVFDIEIIFFFPWAMSYGSLGLFGLVTIVVFAAAVFESFVYLIGNGALEWGPRKREVPTELVTPSRTTRTTVRRVGTEGRAGVVDDHDDHASHGHGGHEEAA